MRFQRKKRGFSKEGKKKCSSICAKIYISAVSPPPSPPPPSRTAPVDGLEGAVFFVV
jgi:hypothetical protein